MKINTSDKVLAYLALLSGLTISGVAIWYSVAGLVSIFAAAVTPIIVMGVALEVSKLIATVWLKLNWSRAPVFIRSYLLVAIAILMVITSMGIFGFLSKAHSDQSLVSGDVQAKISVYDEKIKTAKENIDANRKALKQMDEAVDQVMARSSSETGADKAVGVRRSQQKERARLQSEIQAEQKTITTLSEERAPIAAEVRKVEAEVGPIKYIAAFIYGDNPDANILEKAVTWVIIIIVSVFDPLAVILLLASQYSFQWFRKAEEDTDQDVIDWFEAGKERARQLDAEAVANVKVEEVPITEGDSPTSSESVDSPTVTPLAELTPTTLPEFGSVQLPEFAPIEVEPTVQKEVVEEVPEAVVEEEVSLAEKEAITRWKHENPDSSLKEQRRLLDHGAIHELPWMKYMKITADYIDESAEAAREALRWAQEQIANPDEESKKKDSELDGKSGQETSNKNPGEVGYTQNAEQGEGTLWSRIHKQ